MPTKKEKNRDSNPPPRSSNFVNLDCVIQVCGVFMGIWGLAYMDLCKDRYQYANVYFEGRSSDSTFLSRLLKRANKQISISNW